MLPILKLSNFTIYDYNLESTRICIVDIKKSFSSNNLLQLIFIPIESLHTSSLRISLTECFCNCSTCSWNTYTFLCVERYPWLDIIFFYMIWSFSMREYCLFIHVTKLEIFKTIFAI